MRATLTVTPPIPNIMTVTPVLLVTLLCGFSCGFLAGEWSRFGGGSHGTRLTTAKAGNSVVPNPPSAPPASGYSKAQPSKYIAASKPVVSEVVWEPNPSNKTSKRHETPIALVDRHPRQVPFVNFNGFVTPKFLDAFKLAEVEPVWLEKEKSRAYPIPAYSHTIAIPYSVVVPPDPVALAKHNTGYIMVAVTSCCKSWDITRVLLQALLDMDDPIHVVLIDDNSKDGTQEKAAAMGIPVLTTTHMTGLTASFNRAWKYFASYHSLQSLFILNNDVEIAPGAFTKLHRCAMAMPISGVLGPVSDTHGLGGGQQGQNIDLVFPRTTFYKGTKPSKTIRNALPASLKEMDAWLDAATSHAASFGRVYAVPALYGFFIGFRKDFSIADYANNVLVIASLNTEQEYSMFTRWKNKAYVCADVFAYHVKAATFKDSNSNSTVGTVGRVHFHG